MTELHIAILDALNRSYPHPLSEPDLLNGIPFDVNDGKRALKALLSKKGDEEACVRKTPNGDGYLITDAGRNALMHAQSTTNEQAALSQEEKNQEREQTAHPFKKALKKRAMTFAKKATYHLLKFLLSQYWTAFLPVLWEWFISFF